MLLVAALLIGLAPSPQEERKPSLTGNIKMHREFASQHLNSKRDLIVYLPPGYASGSRERYPVLYMGDGQNLFDGMTSFIPNKEWRLDEAAESLILSKLIEPIIIVGIYNGGMERADEYLPTRSKVGNTEAGGKADIFARMVVEEIKPMIDRTYRTRTGREDTAIGGSRSAASWPCTSHSLDPTFSAKPPW
jgi:predicted alpha/beta superfamily hydrolase